MGYNLANNSLSSENLCIWCTKINTQNVHMTQNYNILSVFPTFFCVSILKISQILPNLFLIFFLQFC